MSQPLGSEHCGKHRTSYALVGWSPAELSSQSQSPNTAIESVSTTHLTALNVYNTEGLGLPKTRIRIAANYWDYQQRSGITT